MYVPNFACCSEQNTAVVEGSLLCACVTYKGLFMERSDQVLRLQVHKMIKALYKYLREVQ